MKIYDCFTFYNEVDLLCIRLEYLYDYVDHFVITESNYTFSGMKKSYNFEANKSRFEKFFDKIIYIKVESKIQNKINLNANQKAWETEFEQRNQLIKGIIQCNSSDVIILSDIDEIPHLKSIKKALKILTFYKNVTLQQSLHLYYVNCLAIGTDSFWKGSVMFKARNFLGTMQEHRELRSQNKSLKNGGYHFSYLGGIESIITKIESFAHTEFNNTEFKDRKVIKKRILTGEDIFGRENHATKIIPSKQLKIDSKLNKILVDYPHLFIDKIN